MAKKKFIPRPKESAKVIKKRWHKKREKVELLAEKIRSLRWNISRDLKDDDEKTCLTALVIAIMDKTSERIGNDSSAANGHFGVTGFKKKHFTVIGNKVHLKYTGKSGVDHEKSFSDEKIAKALKAAIKNSPSKNVFVTSDGFQIKQDRVNRYLEDFLISAKDIRGFSCNNQVVKKLKEVTPEEKETQRKKQFLNIIRSVAKKIGHGSGTLRKHYLLPEIEPNFIEKGKVIEIDDVTKYNNGGAVVDEEKLIVKQKKKMGRPPVKKAEKKVETKKKPESKPKQKDEKSDAPFEVGSVVIESYELKEPKRYKLLSFKGIDDRGRYYVYNAFDLSFGGKDRVTNRVDIPVDKKNREKHWSVIDLKNKLLAPNGLPSNLTAEQYKIVRTPEFKKWFGDWEKDPKNSSKVIDENGEPLVVYHGTLSGGFYEFNVGKVSDEEFDKIYGSQFRSGADPTAFLGSHFSKERSVSEMLLKGLYAHEGKNPMIYECFLNIRNILNISEEGLTEELQSQNAEDSIAIEREFDIDDETYLENEYGTSVGDELYEKYKKHRDFRVNANMNALAIEHSDSISLAIELSEKYKEKLVSNKINGIEYSNKYEGGTSFIVFEPNQIKLADGTNVKFSKKSPDIRYSKGGEAKELDIKVFNHLYKEHHEAWDTMQEIEDNVCEEVCDKYTKKLLGVWDSELKPHFKEEEENLFPFIMEKGNKSEVNELLDEHKELEAIIRIIQKNEKKTDKIKYFCKRLKEHIKKEEKLMSKFFKDPYKKEEKKNGGDIENNYVVFFKSNLLNSIVYVKQKAKSENEAVEIVKPLYSFSEIKWIKSFPSPKEAEDGVMFFYEAVRDSFKNPFVSLELSDGKIFFSGFGNNVGFDFMTSFELKNGDKVFKEGYLKNRVTEIKVESDFKFDIQKIIDILKGEEKKSGGDIDSNEVKQKLINILSGLDEKDLFDFVYHIGGVESNYVDDIVAGYKNWINDLPKDELDMILWRMKMPYFYEFSPKDNYTTSTPVPSKFATYNDFYEKKYKKGGALNPFAVCTSSIGKKEGTTKRSDWDKDAMKRYESCVLAVKEKKAEGGELTVNRKKVYEGDKLLMDMTYEEAEKYMSLYHEKKGNFMIPKNFFVAWMYDDANFSEKINNGEYDFLMFPPPIKYQSFRLGYGVVESIWRANFQKLKGAKHLLGMVQGWYDEENKKVVVQYMSVRPSAKRNKINTFLVKGVKKFFETDEVEFDEPTKEGTAFIEGKTYRNGGQVKNFMKISNQEGEQVGVMRYETNDRERNVTIADMAALAIEAGYKVEPISESEFENAKHSFNNKLLQKFQHDVDVVSGREIKIQDPNEKKNGGVIVGEEMQGNKFPTLKEAYEILKNTHEHEGHTWLGGERGDATFDNKQQADKYVREIYNFLKEYWDKEFIPVYRSISADKVDLDPYGIGESWSVYLENAKQFGRHLGVPLSRVKIISGYVPSENVDWESAFRLFLHFSDFHDADSEFELPIPSNNKILDVNVFDFKEAKELPKYQKMKNGGDVESSESDDHDNYNDYFYGDDDEDNLKNSMVSYLEENAEKFEKSFPESERFILSHEEKITFRKQEEFKSELGHKPKGLWYGLGMSWIYGASRFARHLASTYEYIHKLTINENRVCILDTPEKYIDFTKKYGEKASSRIDWMFINWNKVSKDYSGIETHNPRGAVGHIGNEIEVDGNKISTMSFFNWLLSWDVSGGCIWNEDAIKNIDLVFDWKLHKVANMRSGGNIKDWEDILDEYYEYQHRSKQGLGYYDSLSKWLEDNYIIEKKSLDEIDNYDYFKTKTPLREWLKKFEIPKNKKKSGGDLNENFAIVYRSIKGEWNPEYKGWQYYSNDKEYSQVWGRNTKKFKIDLSNSLNLEKWNKLMLEAEPNDKWKHFQIGDLQMQQEFQPQAELLANRLGVEKYNEFMNEFRSSDVIYGQEIGHNSIAYAVRNPKVVQEVIDDNMIHYKTTSGRTVSLPKKNEMKSGGELTDDEKSELYSDWREFINMSASELEKFYNSEEGKEAGLSKKEADDLGIKSGRESAKWIMKMKKTPNKDWTPYMWEWAKRQVAFVKRMKGNKGDLFDDKGNKTRKHLALLIWGHNPKK